ncbi:hypothetical protein AG1IA_05641 [Rhizoctonia solani AG-1 IA]|uniref:Uncharacterized protein n=1 Tax=Thanatephorus cucumeris (strain AG1-IA) TaxID=983506 RepID=L8WU92_THACA|nr:hypothetical protein AG1IA_05641 [Rhizoctonia solani AG-1 IA]
MATIEMSYFNQIVVCTQIGNLHCILQTRVGARKFQATAPRQMPRASNKSMSRGMANNVCGCSRAPVPRTRCVGYSKFIFGSHASNAGGRNTALGRWQCRVRGSRI